MSKTLKQQCDEQCLTHSLSGFVSGFGAQHTNNTDSKGTASLLVDISLKDIRALVDAPPSVDKNNAQWLIPSSLMSRAKDDHVADGRYYLQWLDFDAGSPALLAIVLVLDALGIVDYEIYSSRSATKTKLKWRVLIPSVEQTPEDWRLIQECLNDAFAKEGITPDPVNLGYSQLCYLPNKGEHYETKSVRTGALFDGCKVFEEEIAHKVLLLAEAARASEKRREEAKQKREALQVSGFKSPIEAFNAAFAVEDILVQAGYDQRGDTFSHPNSQSGSFAASIDPKTGRLHSLSGSDPLYTGGLSDSTGAHDAFSCFEVLFHGGDRSKALKDAGDNWLKVGGESWNKVSQREWRQAQDSEKETPMPEEKEGDKKRSCMDWLKEFSVTGTSEKMKEQMVNDVFVMDRIAILGQWTAFYASPNTGKTLMTLWLIIEQIKAGAIKAEDVFYINVDDTFKGGVQKTEIAEKHGFHMLLPEQNGFKKEYIKKMLPKLVEEGEASGKVIILDTLKKFCNLMDKKESSEFGDICRNFVAAGGTIIALAHTNKRKGDDGKSIYSGTSDIVDDADCMFLIEKVSTEVLGAGLSRSTIEFVNEKNRGDVAASEMFEFSGAGGDYNALFNSVARLNEDDIQKAKQAQKIQEGHEKDRNVVDSILKFIGQEPLLKTRIVELVVEDLAVTKKRATDVLNRWEGDKYENGHLWRLSKGDKNQQLYIINKSQATIGMKKLAEMFND